MAAAECRHSANIRVTIGLMRRRRFALGASGALRQSPELKDWMGRRDDVVSHAQKLPIRLPNQNVQLYLHAFEAIDAKVFLLLEASQPHGRSYRLGFGWSFHPTLAPSSILPPIKKRMEPGVDRPHRTHDAIVRTKSVYGNARQRYGVNRPRRTRRTSSKNQIISMY